MDSPGRRRSHKLTRKAGSNPSPVPLRLMNAPDRDTLPDVWGPMDPIGVQKSDSPRERVANEDYFQPSPVGRGWRE